MTYLEVGLGQLNPDETIRAIIPEFVLGHTTFSGLPVSAEMKDFSQLSSKTVTEVLMLEIKMSPAAKTFLVSGYPRNMRDVVEYSNKASFIFIYCIFSDN